MAERLSTFYANEQLNNFKTAYANGVMAIYSGSQPATADEAETGTLLCLLTKDAQPFTAGDPTNGLNFGDPAGGVVDIAPGEVWSGIVLQTGVAGWFRFYDNNYVTGESDTARRFDGAISPSSSAELQMANTTLTAGDTAVLESFPVSYPVA